MKKALKIFIIIIVIITFTKKANSQDFATGLAQIIPLSENQVEDGSVICSSATGFRMCTKPYTASMFGVVTDNPAGYYDPAYTVQNGRYVLNTGVVPVRYVLGGELIKSGEMVTSSETSGAVMKSTENGYVLGTAVKDADPATGKVEVAINIHPEAELATTRSNLIAILREGTQAPVLSPLDSLRYLIAAMLIIASFVIGFIYFGRMANTGVEAIGRNPLATRQIQFNMFLHIGITIVIVLVGLLISYIVLII